MYKICTHCNTNYPATNEFFSKAKKRKDGLAAICKQCKKESYLRNSDERRKKAREYYYKNRVSKLEYAKDYQKKNEGKTKLYLKNYRKENKKNIREYYESNRALLIEKKKEYRKNNRGKINTYKREFRRENKEKVTAYSREYYRKNKDVFRVDRLKRKSNKKGLISSYSRKEWQECKQFFNHACAYCGSKDSLTQDHVISISKNGPYAADNIVPSCGSCNSRKNNKDMETWYRMQKFYSEERETAIRKYIWEKSANKETIY